jgi:hypothetical protein
MPCTNQGCISGVTWLSTVSRQFNQGWDWGCWWRIVEVLRGAGKLQLGFI